MARVAAGRGSAALSGLHRSGAIGEVAPSECGGHLPRRCVRRHDALVRRVEDAHAERVGEGARRGDDVRPRHRRAAQASAPRRPSSVQPRSSQRARRAPERSAPVRSQSTKRTARRSASWKSVWRRMQRSKTTCSIVGRRERREVDRAVAQRRRRAARPRSTAGRSCGSRGPPRAASGRCARRGGQADVSSSRREGRLIRRPPLRSAPAMRRRPATRPGLDARGVEVGGAESSGRSGGSGAIGRRATRAVHRGSSDRAAIRSAP